MKNCASSGVRWEGPRIVEGFGVAFCGHPQITARPVSLLCTCRYLHPAKIPFVESCAQDRARHCEHPFSHSSKLTLEEFHRSPRAMDEGHW